MTAGFDQALPSNDDSQIFTSLSPSFLPPNQAARNLPFSASAIVASWQAGVARISEMNMMRSPPPPSPPDPLSREGRGGTGKKQTGSLSFFVRSPLSPRGRGG